MIRTRTIATYRASTHRLRELERFFLDYKVLEDKVGGAGMRGREEANHAIRAATRLYRDKLRPGVART